MVVFQQFTAAEELQVGDGGLAACEHLVDEAFAHHVLYLAAAEVEFVGQPARFLIREVGHHVLPDVGFHLGGGLVETQLVEEAAFEGLVEVALEVGGGDEDAVEGLHLLEDDVLEGVLAFVDRAFGIFHTAVEDGIGFVEEHDGGRLGVLDDVAVFVEDALYLFLAFAVPFGAELADVDLIDVASAGACQLQDGLGLAGAGSAVEQAGEATAETAFLQTGQHTVHMFGLEQLCEAAYLADSLGVVEHLLWLDVLVLGQAVAPGFLRLVLADKTVGSQLLAEFVAQ